MMKASPSNPSYVVDVGPHVIGPHVIGPNFVTVKLSSKIKYNLWRLQMECLLKSQHMVSFINGQSPNPAENGKGKGKEGDMEAWVASDSLVKGWILGSLSEEVARKAVNHLTHMQKNTDFSAKDLWEELQRSYGPSVVAFQKKSCGPSVCEQAAVSSISEDAESVIEAISKSEDAKSVVTEVISESEDAKSVVTEVISKSEDAKSKDTEKLRRRRLYEDILQGKTSDDVIQNLKSYSLDPWDKITNNENTVLHAAVGSSTKNHELLKKLLEMTPNEKLLDIINSDGSTLLHVAAIGGNIEAVNTLVETNSELLKVKDNEGHTPLALSVSNMHTKASHCLFGHMKAHKYGDLFSGQSGEDLVVLAISCQDFRLANMIIKEYPDAILSDSDAVLTALAQNFPRKLNFSERGWRQELHVRRINSYDPISKRLENYFDWPCGRQLLWIYLGILYIVFCLLAAVASVFNQCHKKLVQLFFEDTLQIHEDATDLLSNVCDLIATKFDPSTYHQYYTTSTFEATRRNATIFIRCLMNRFPDAIWSTNEDGHNFIQYSVINRSEKIYNLVYEMSEHKNIYKTIKDSSGNNLLHLVARLAPTNKLNLLLGAALRIQRELQWFKEVERFVCPLNQIQKNLDEETPQEVFTREHKGLVIEGEIWIKKTAESYTITAALIITIVFAAAITVPGGNNQSGIPIFTNNTAFTVFAISDAMSLFTAVTSLLMFLSILTARFAEQDFLFKLPTKLIIGLSMLFLSTTSMIIAFGATLFLEFGQSNTSMLIPIGALTCLPITSFVTLQFPLIVELIRATYCGGIFVREDYRYFY